MDILTLPDLFRRTAPSNLRGDERARLIDLFNGIEAKSGVNSVENCIQELNKVPILDRVRAMLRFDYYSLDTQYNSDALLQSIIASVAETAERVHGTLIEKAFPVMASTENFEWISKSDSWHTLNAQKRTGILKRILENVRKKSGVYFSDTAVKNVITVAIQEKDFLSACISSLRLVVREVLLNPANGVKYPLAKLIASRPEYREIILESPSYHNAINALENNEVPFLDLLKSVHAKRVARIKPKKKREDINKAERPAPVPTVGKSPFSEIYDYFQSNVRFALTINENLRATIKSTTRNQIRKNQIDDLCNFQTNVGFTHIIILCSCSFFKELSNNKSNALKESISRNLGKSIKTIVYDIWTKKQTEFISPAKESTAQEAVSRVVTKISQNLISTTENHYKRHMQILRTIERLKENLDNLRAGPKDDDQKRTIGKLKKKIYHLKKAQIRASRQLWTPLHLLIQLGGHVKVSELIHSAVKGILEKEITSQFNENAESLSRIPGRLRPAYPVKRRANSLSRNAKRDMLNPFIEDLFAIFGTMELGEFRGLFYQALEDRANRRPENITAREIVSALPEIVDDGFRKSLCCDLEEVLGEINPRHSIELEPN